MKIDSKRILSSTAILAVLLLVRPCRLVGQSPNLSFDGTAFVQAVDDHRVLVAIDTFNEGQAEDGVVDHLFMFTAAQPLKFTGPTRPMHVHLEYTDHALIIVREGPWPRLELVVNNETSSLPPARAGAIRFEKGIGLSHRWGKGLPRMAELEHLRRSPQCDHVPGSCYKAGEYHLNFPA